MAEKAIWLCGIGQALILIGIYAMLLMESIAGIIILAAGAVSLALYYLLKGKEPASDEMFDAIYGKSSNFSFIVTSIAIAGIAIAQVLSPSLLPLKSALLILFTAMLLSKMGYHAYWYFSLVKNEPKHKNKRV